MLLEKILGAVSWFFRITLAKIWTSSWLFQHPCPISELFRSWKKKSQILGLFQDFSGLRHSIVVRTSILAGELSLSCARLMDGCLTTLWVKHLLSVNQQGQLSLPSLQGRLNE